MMVVMITGVNGRDEGGDGWNKRLNGCDILLSFLLLLMLLLVVVVAFSQNHQNDFAFGMPL